MADSDHLTAFRHSASEKSGGTSHSSLYSAAFQRIEKLDLRGTILDFGAGAGHLTYQLASDGRFNSVLALDLFPRPMKIPDGVRWVQADLNNTCTLNDATVDTIISLEVIEHLENPRAIMREWYRLLRPGGHLLFSTPNNENWRSLVTLIVKGHFQQFTDRSYPAHITALLKKDIEHIVAESGFTDLSFEYVIPATLYGRVTFRTLLPLIKGKGRRTAMNVICTCLKPNV